ncbi:MAG TPA: 30S ribosomal protein S17 [Candidatus Nanoarchaeia archaeon]|nr:30S ribosomal protein S17 [Candidatus Nanoarchaeia archaeon]
MKTCEDRKCPVHGKVSTRGRTFEGVVIAKDLHRSATIEFQRMIFNQKYERYLRGFTRLRTHNPACMNAEIGDHVVVSECRPLSKSKKTVIIRKAGKDELFQEKLERRKESLTRREDGPEAAVNTAEDTANKDTRDE